jgi:hypothetical protein
MKIDEYCKEVEVSIKCKHSHAKCYIGLGQHELILACEVDGNTVSKPVNSIEGIEPSEFAEMLMELV